MNTHDCDCNEHEHEHIHHDDECCCNEHEHEHHDHEHEHEHHHHDHDHDHDHDHGHDHHHHDHEHGHDHGHDHDHHHHHHDHDHDDDCECCSDENGIHIEHHEHEGANVVSGKCSVSGDYGKIREQLSAGLTSLADAINEQGGIIGHIKASAEVGTVEMFSITDKDLMAKTAPTQNIDLHIAAIVFAVDIPFVEDAVKKIFESIKNGQ